MCLAIPMKLTEIGADAKATAEIEGVRHDVDVSLLESPRVGQYVIVHAGFAIETLDEDRANEILALFAEMAKTDGETP
jgi:hydrogenase expression/formation protein HypC